MSSSRLLSFFDEVEASCDLVVVNGDIFDLSRPRIPGGWRKHLDAIDRAYPRVVKRLERFCWTYGNHDRTLHRLGVPEERLFKVDGMSVLATHGHQGDGGLNRVPGLAAAANFVAGWCQRFGYPSVSEFAEATRDRFASARAALPSIDSRPASTEGSSGYDVVVVGHDHTLSATVNGETLVACCGSLTGPRGQWVCVDTTQGKVTGLDWSTIEFEFVQRQDRWLAVEI